MRKFILTFMVLIGNIAVTFAQNDTVLYMTNHPLDVEVCLNQFSGATIYGPECQDYLWTVRYNSGYEQHPEGNPINITGVFDDFYSIQYNGCGFSWGFNLHFIDDRYVPNSFTQEIWKHQNETITLEAVGADSTYWYTYLWLHSNENTRTVDITNDTIYTVQIYDLCGTAIRTFIVRDNVEIDMATCDLESNLNLVTWQTNPAQAQYIDHVIVKRDGLQVGTAPYSDGQFTDNIGSGSASRTYTVTAIATDGTECPIVSYPKETIHMSYTLGMNSTIEIGWNTPTGYDLLGYNICEWHEDDGSLSVIDFVGASVTSYTCSESQFDQGYIVVQGVEAGKDGETRLLSNRSLDIVGLGENETTTFKVYPNPAKDRFTVEGSGTMTITNALGQTLLTREIDGKTTIELPQGLYFVKLGGATRKIVVE